MWVVKLGGSLNNDPVLRQWLALLARLGGGRVTVVCGGGQFADEVRQSQQHWQLDDLAAHNMAVLAMAQSAYQAQALQPQLQLADSEPAIRQVLRGGRAAVWLPLEMCRHQADDTTNWEVAGDAMALNLARRLNAERLVVVKSCPVPPSASLADLVGTGVLDAGFARLAADAGFPIDLLHRADLETLRARLLGRLH